MQDPSSALNSKMGTQDRFDWIDFIPKHHPMVIQRFVSYVAIIHNSDKLFSFYYLIYTCSNYLQILIYSISLAATYSGYNFHPIFNLITRFDILSFSLEAQNEIIIITFLVTICLYLLLIPILFYDRPFWYMAWYNSNIITPCCILAVHLLLSSSITGLFISIHHAIKYNSFYFFLITIPCATLNVAGEYMSILFFDLYPCFIHRLGSKWVADSLSFRIFAFFTFALLQISVFFFDPNNAEADKMLLFGGLICVGKKDIFRIFSILCFIFFILLRSYNFVKIMNFVFPSHCSIVLTSTCVSSFVIFLSIFKIDPLPFVVPSILFAAIFFYSFAKRRIKNIQQTALEIIRTKNFKEFEDLPLNNFICYVCHSLAVTGNDLTLWNYAFKKWPNSLVLNCAYVRFVLTQPNPKELMFNHAIEIYRTSTKSFFDMVTVANYHLVLFGAYINPTKNENHIYHTVNCYLNCLHLFWNEVLAGRTQRMESLLSYVNIKFMEVVALISHLKIHDISFSGSIDYKLLLLFIDKKRFLNILENFSAFLAHFNNFYMRDSFRNKKVLYLKHTKFSFLYNYLMNIPFIFGLILFVGLIHTCVFKLSVTQNFWNTTYEYSKTMEQVSSFFNSGKQFKKYFLAKNDILKNELMAYFGNNTDDTKSSEYISKQSISNNNPNQCDINSPSFNYFYSEKYDDVYGKDWDYFSYTNFFNKIIVLILGQENVSIDFSKKEEIINIMTLINYSEQNFKDFIYSTYNELSRNLNKFTYDVYKAATIAAVLSILITIILERYINKYQLNYINKFLNIPKTAVAELLDKLNNRLATNYDVFPSSDIELLPDDNKYNLRLLTYQNPPSTFWSQNERTIYFYMNTFIYIFLLLGSFIAIVSFFSEKQQEGIQCIPMLTSLLLVPERVHTFSHFSLALEKSNISSTEGENKYLQKNKNKLEAVGLLLKNSFQPLLTDSSNCPICFDQKLMFDTHTSSNFSLMSALNYAISNGYEFINTNSLYYLKLVGKSIDNVKKFDVLNRTNEHMKSIIQQNEFSYFEYCCCYVAFYFILLCIARFRRMDIEILPDFLIGSSISIPMKNSISESEDEDNNEDLVVYDNTVIVQNINEQSLQNENEGFDENYILKASENNVSTDSFYSVNKNSNENIFGTNNNNSNENFSDDISLNDSSSVNDNSSQSDSNEMQLSMNSSFLDRKENTKDASNILNSVSLLDDLNSAVILVNKHGQIVRRSKKAKEMLTFNAGEKSGTESFVKFMKSNFVVHKNEININGSKDKNVFFNKESGSDNVSIKSNDNVGLIKNVVCGKYEDIPLKDINLKTLEKIKTTSLKNKNGEIFTLTFVPILYSNQTSFACYINNVTKREMLIKSMNHNANILRVLMSQLVPYQVARIILDTGNFDIFCTSRTFGASFFVDIDLGAEVDITTSLSSFGGLNNSSGKLISFHTNTLNDLDNLNNNANDLISLNELDSVQKTQKNIIFMQKVVKEQLSKHKKLTFIGRSCQAFQIISGLFDQQQQQIQLQPQSQTQQQQQSQTQQKQQQGFDGNSRQSQNQTSLNSRNGDDSIKNGIIRRQNSVTISQHNSYDDQNQQHIASSSSNLTALSVVGFQQQAKSSSATSNSINSMQSLGNQNEIVKEIVEFSINFVKEMKNAFGKNVKIYNGIDFLGHTIADVISEPFPKFEVFANSIKTPTTIALNSQPNQINIGRAVCDYLNESAYDVTFDNKIDMNGERISIYKLQRAIKD